MQKMSSTAFYKGCPKQNQSYTDILVYLKMTFQKAETLDRQTIPRGLMLNSNIGPGSFARYKALKNW